jgi:hypothetical protein
VKEGKKAKGVEEEEIRDMTEILEEVEIAGGATVATRMRMDGPQAQPQTVMVEDGSGGRNSYKRKICHGLGKERKAKEALAIPASNQLNSFEHT